ncbi:FANCC protein, partial [Psilopogon haemacephalus]|nr:FANCC protein [Psilopogon haemacephalus]
SKWESNEAETSTFISTLGYTSADYYCYLVKSMVLSLVTELKGNNFNGLNIRGRVSDDYVNAVSHFCLPLITLPDLTPLLETLLCYHGGASKEILSSEFLEAVNECFLKKKISLPASAVSSLWLRHLPSLEKATLYLLDQLVSIQSDSLEEVACVIKDSFLPQAASYPAIFRIVNEIFKNALLETDGDLGVMTTIQHEFPLKVYFPYHHQPLVIALSKRHFEVPTTYWPQHLKHISDIIKALVEDSSISSLADLFEIWFLVAVFGEWIDIAAEQLLKAAVEPDALLWLLAFYYCPQNENQQRTQTMVEAQAVYSHLVTLFSCTVLSIKDLEAAVHNIADTEHCCIQHLITHLLTCFLLFSSGGHTIAQELIYHITETSDRRKEVCSLLNRTVYRINHDKEGDGEEKQRTVKLLNELLQKLKV